MSAQPSAVERSSTDSDNHEVKQFVPQENTDESEPGQEPISRTPSMLERIQSRVSFFNPKLKSHRGKMIKQFGMIYTIMLVFILGVFSIYWGAFYQRNSRLKNLNMLVVIEDEAVNGVEPVIGNTIREILDTPEARGRGNWIIHDTEEFRREASERGNTVEEEIERRIHHQLYWSSIYVTRNASYNYRNLILENDSSVNSSALINSYYETGRDFINMQAYVTPQVEFIQGLWLHRQSALQSLFNDTDSFTLNQASRLAEPITFDMHDRIPYTNPVLAAPSQVGLIYIIILTFFQVNMFTNVHQEVGKIGIKEHHYLLYRLGSSYLSYFVLSLGYSLVSLAFQVDFTPAFGKSGFLVYWMFSYITMIAVGIMNEVAFMALIMIFPPVAGFWLLFWVLINIASTFAPIALCPQFYRFGYAMPIHNSYELTKVVLFDTYKGQMGRNIGIIIAWIVIGSALFTILLPLFGKTMKKRAIAAAQAQAAAEAKNAEEKKGEA